MRHGHHRHVHHGSPGVMVGKLLLGVATSLLQKKITDKLAGKSPQHKKSSDGGPDIPPGASGAPA